MTTEEKIKQLEERVKELERKAIQVSLSVTERENIKNAIFDGYYQSDKTEMVKTDSTPFIKLVWKNKIIYLPYYV